MLIGDGHYLKILPLNSEAKSAKILSFEELIGLRLILKCLSSDSRLCTLYEKNNQSIPPHSSLSEKSYMRILKFGLESSILKK